MKTIQFFAAGIPKGQPRPRAFVRKFGNKFSARVYDAGTAEGWKSQIADAAKTHLPVQPLASPLRVKVTLYFPRPKVHFRSNGSLKYNQPVYHTQKPDGDNCMKAVLDSLTQIGMWRDDKQVAIQKVTKLYANQIAGALIEIAALEETTEQETPVEQREMNALLA